MFKELRCADHTSSLFDTLKAETVMGFVIGQLSTETQTQLYVPPSKRGAPRDATRRFKPDQV
jgi:hypothetical protein